MLSSQLHPKSLGLDWLIAIPRTLFLLIILHFINGATVAAQNINLTIPINSTEIIFTPFACNASRVLADPQTCAGAWRLSNSSLQTISTTGPSPASGNIIPQMFFEFQASSFFLTTLPSSNASVNITVSAGGVDVWAIFDSSLGSVSVVNLPQNETALVSITYMPTVNATQFDLRSLVLTVPANESIISILPLQTLPPSASLASFTPTTLSSSVTPTVTVVIEVTSNKKMIGQAVGITIGLSLGLTVLTAGVFYYWKRRIQRRMAIEIQVTKSHWNRHE
ncbi:hypothetical protein BYT27DRAFT_7190483 [Phlegmacium glaucopus]|nr:hypothetical protein BYT27DRAFT_7190483 [Phlegmacium glaucopus]